MTKTILLTGSTGFIGKRTYELLKDKYNILAPVRGEMNVVNQQSVDDYLKNKQIDIVVHCAILTPNRNENDREEDILDYTMRGLLNFKRHENEFEKIIYIGSGAEYDKSKDIINAKEDDIGKVIPKDSYGYAKYIMNEIARQSNNIYNLRIFGCYGIREQERRFIRSVITDCLDNRPITIKQNCKFSYVLVDDLVTIIDWVITNTPKYKDYNVCTDEQYYLTDLAKIVKEKMQNQRDIVIINDGYNLEYTGDNSRLKNEAKINFTRVEKGIEQEINWMRESYNEKKSC